MRGEGEIRKRRETDQTDGTARRGRREYVRGAVLGWDPMETPKRTREETHKLQPARCAQHDCCFESRREGGDSNGTVLVHACTSPWSWAP